MKSPPPPKKKQNKTKKNPMKNNNQEVHGPTLISSQKGSYSHINRRIIHHERDGCIKP